MLVYTSLPLQDVPIREKASTVAMVNIVSVLSAFVLAITQIKNKKKRNGLSNAAFTISGGQFFIMVGILTFALIYNVTL